MSKNRHSVINDKQKTIVLHQQDQTGEPYRYGANEIRHIGFDWTDNHQLLCEKLSAAQTANYIRQVSGCFLYHLTTYTF